MNKKLEEENEELRRELIKSKRNEVTPEMWAGGAVGIVGYAILKAIGGWGWHGGDIKSWTKVRKYIIKAIHKNGSFLDLSFCTFPLIHPKPSC